ncbi:MAG: hypothetical protein V4486_02295 [Patescibacteria group bacterium]
MTTLKYVLLSMVLVAMVPNISAAQLTHKDKVVPQPADACQEVISLACQVEYDAWFAGDMEWRMIYIPNSPNEKLIRREKLRWLNSPVPVRRPSIPLWLGPRCLPEMSYQIKSPMCQAYDEALRYDFVEHLDNTWSSKTYTTRVPLKIGEGNGFIEYLFSHLHVDGVLWDGSIQFAFAGTHLELAKAGRYGIWGVPGVIFFREWNGTIVMKMTEGADVHIRSIPIGRYSLPTYFTVAALLDANEAKARKHGVETGTVIVGLSFTLLK